MIAVYLCCKRYLNFPNQVAAAACPPPLPLCRVLTQHSSHTHQFPHSPPHLRCPPLSPPPWLVRSAPRTQATSGCRECIIIPLAGTDTTSLIDWKYAGISFEERVSDHQKNVDLLTLVSCSSVAATYVHALGRGRERQTNYGLTLTDKCQTCDCHTYTVLNICGNA